MEEIEKYIVRNDALKEVLISIFKQMDEVDTHIDALRRKIRELINFFEDEDESKDPKVIEYVKQKEIYLEQYRFLYDTARDISDRLSENNKPVKFECSCFQERFKDTQDALDFINKELNRVTVLEGTKELFQGLAYKTFVSSLSPLNLFYINYKLPRIFGIEGKLEYSKMAYTDEYKSFIESFIYQGLKKNVQEIFEQVKAGTLCSFDYYSILCKAYNFLELNFSEKPDIRQMLNEIQETNSDLFKDSPLIAYGVDEDQFN
jgi:hypothetical protein